MKKLAEYQTELDETLQAMADLQELMNTLSPDEQMAQKTSIQMRDLDQKKVYLEKIINYGAKHDKNGNPIIGGGASAGYTTTVNL